VLGRAVELYPVRLHGVVVLSTHFHLLIAPESVDQMSGFMQHLTNNLSREVGRLHDWPGPMFARRYTSIPVSDEPGAQIARMEYLLSNGCKEGLVLSPRDWPGVQSAEALADGVPLVGEWIDRTAYRSARNKDRNVSIRQFTERYEVHLEPLPCWKHLAGAVWRARVADLVEEIEKKTLKMHHGEGTVPLGSRAVRRVHPHRKPSYESRSPRPMVHALTRRVRDEMIAAYREFEVAYRHASARFRSGEWSVTFPPGTWKPHLLVPGPG